MASESSTAKNVDDKPDQDDISIHDIVEITAKACPYCPNYFESEEYLSTHLDRCKPSIKNVINIPLRQCLLCRRRMPQFSLCGLIRHANVCVIEREESKVNVKLEVKDSDATDDNDKSFKIKVETQDEYDEPTPSSSKTVQIKTRSNMKHGQRQITILTNFFNSDPYPTSEDVEDFLTIETGLSKKQIKIWFVNRRRNLKLNPVKPVETTQPEGVTFKRLTNRVKTIDEIKPSPNLYRTFKRPRRTPKYTDEQYEILEASYLKNQSPDQRTRILLAHATGLTSIQVNMYIHNRRRGENRRERKMTKNNNRRKPRITASPSKVQNTQDFVVNRVKSVKKPSSDSDRYEILQAYCDENPDVTDLDIKARQALSKETGVDMKYISTWFYNRNYRKKGIKRSRGIRKVSHEMSNAAIVSGRLDEATINILEDHFQRIQDPTIMDLFDIGKATGLRMKQIKDWFAKKRRKSKIENIEKITHNQRIIGSARSRKSPSIKNEHSDYSTSFGKNRKVKPMGMTIQRKFGTPIKIEADDVKMYKTPVAIASNSVIKVRKHRSSNSDSKYQILHEYRSKNKTYPDLETRRILSRETGLSLKAMNDWFYTRINKRLKKKKCRKIKRENETVAVGNEEMHYN